MRQSSLFTSLVSLFLTVSLAPTMRAAVGVGAPPGAGGLNPGLYVQVLDSTIHVANGGGTQTFTAGQFGYTGGFTQPPVILPNNPGLQFTPPPSFSSTTGGQTTTVSAAPLVSVTVDGVTGNTTVAALTGNVTLTLKDGSKVTVNIGTGLVVSSTGSVVANNVSLASLVKGNPSLAADLSAAVTAVSNFVQTQPAGSAGAGQSLTLLATIVKVASAANPIDAAGYVSIAATAVAKSPAFAGQTNTALNAVVQAATSNSGVNATAVNDSAAAAATSAGTTFTASSTASTAVVTTAVVNTTIDVTTISPSH